MGVLDRQTFRHMLANDSNEKRKKYEMFLRSCELFRTLQPEEVSRLADVLEEKVFTDASSVILQDMRAAEEVSDDEFTAMKFYLVFKGCAAAFQRSGDGEDVKVCDYKAGDFFGEKALVERQPRAATVKAVGDLTVATLDVAAFERLLGPVKELLKRHIETYKSTGTAAGGGVQ